MQTQIRPYGPAAIEAAAELILSGRSVAIPTETVYGLAADATNAEAVARIYEAKGRPSFNPLIVHVADMEMAEALADFSPAAHRIAKAYWPGPLTLVLPRRSDCPIATIATAGLPTIALRCPAHPAMQALLAATGKPLAAPSANSSRRLSPTRADHVAKSLEGRIPLIIDAGPTAHGIESTIVAITEDGVRPLRPGPIDFTEIATAAGIPLVEVTSTHVEAPGQTLDHYAPSKPLAMDVMGDPGEAFLIGFGGGPSNLDLSPAGDLVEAAARLFDALHTADAAPNPTIAIRPIPRQGIGLAINDRLHRAAATTRQAKP